jgi:PPK2 family polyphosphate:nucleotide phosphotransferase
MRARCFLWQEIRITQSSQRPRRGRGRVEFEGWATLGIMKTRKLLDEAKKLAAPFCVTNGKKFRLKEFDSGDTQGVKSKSHAEKLLEESSAAVSEMQERLYAQDRWALLLIFQGMDAAGKDGAIKHVMSGINPQGCDVFSFKAPTVEELDHDFLWRCHKVVPERGKIGIFNRSYYEETLIVRVHPAVLAGQKLPERLITKHIWDERFEDINSFERYLTRNGVVIRKFFLHISKEEQRRRFLSRLDDSQKNCKFSMADIKERGFWKDYKEAYEEMVQKTATEYAPWYVVPADNKWFARLIVGAAVVEALSELDLKWPDVDRKKKKELEGIREALEGEKK